jgi:hypothetical protein
VYSGPEADTANLKFRYSNISEHIFEEHIFEECELRSRVNVLLDGKTSISSRKSVDVV